MYKFNSRIGKHVVMLGYRRCTRVRSPSELQCFMFMRARTHSELLASTRSNHMYLNNISMYIKPLHTKKEEETKTEDQSATQHKRNVHEITKPRKDREDY